MIVYYTGIVKNSSRRAAVKKERKGNIMGYRIGVDLGGTNMAAGLLDENYVILHRKSIKTRKNGTPEELADDMTGLVQELCGEAEVELSWIQGLGIGVPGSVTEDGIVEDANNIGFYNVPFKKMMEERTGLTITMINDARAAAMGEYLAGAGKGAKALQMLTIGTGVGGSYIIDGKAVNGCNGAAGEVGHMVIRQNGRACSCGRKGCLEAYASASALKLLMQEKVQENKDSLLWQLAGQNPEHLNGYRLFEALDQKDATAQAIFNEYIDCLADGVTNIINMLQPEVFCIGGGMSAQGEKLLAPLRAAVMERVYSRHSAVQTKILAAELSNDAGIIGAAFGK